MLSRDLLVFQRPLLNFARSSRERMIIVAVAAGLAILQSAWLDKGITLLVALPALAAALAIEFLRGLSRGRPGIQDGSSIVTALVLTLLLPNTIHPVFTVCGTIFAICVVKHCFGGLGGNWLNPALGGWLFIRFSWPSGFGQALGASPLAFISNLMHEGMGKQTIAPVSLLNKNGFGAFNGHSITSFLNTHIFSVFHIELPTAYMDFFINPGPGIIADRGVFALLLGVLLMNTASVSRSFLSLLYIVPYLALVKIAGALPWGGNTGDGDMIFCLLSGGTLVAAFFMAVEPTTNPKSSFGRLFTICAAVLLSFFFRYVKAEAYGALFAMVFVNILTPLIKMMETSCHYKRGGKQNGGLKIQAERNRL